MTQAKDKALKLALEALENGKRVRNAEGGTKYQPDLEDKTITTIKQAIAAPVQPVAILKGIDEYGPVVDWYRHWITVPIGTKLYTTPPPAEFVCSTGLCHYKAQPAPTVPEGYKQSPEHSEVFTKAQLLQYGADCVKAAQPAVQEPITLPSYADLVSAIQRAAEAAGPKLLKEFFNGYKDAQPAVPDALTSADIQEHIEYVAGWNECRQAMLEMMK
jgi:hypothetical protein